MLRIIILFFLGIITLMDAFLAIYFYRRSQTEKNDLEKLLSNCIKGYGVVVDKQSKKSVSGKSSIKKIIIKYVAAHLPQTNSDKIYTYSYQAYSSEYDYYKIGQEIPIAYESARPENIQILKEDGTLRPSYTYTLPYVLSAKMLIFLFLFLEYLFTGKSVLEPFFD